MPNSASCERGFSQLGWICGKYRINLGREKLESINKLYTYYMSNSKNELSYYGRDLTSEEINDIIKNGDLFDEEEIVEEANEAEDKIEEDNDVFVTIEWHPLHIGQVISLDSIVSEQIEDHDYIQLSDQEMDNESVSNKEDSEEEEYDFDSEKVIEEGYEEEAFNQEYDNTDSEY
jgi:hypothetical protein